MESPFSYFVVPLINNSMSDAMFCLDVSHLESSYLAK